MPGIIITGCRAPGSGVEPGGGIEDEDVPPVGSKALALCGGSGGESPCRKLATTSPAPVGFAPGFAAYLSGTLGGVI